MLCKCFCNTFNQRRKSGQAFKKKRPLLGRPGGPIAAKKFVSRCLRVFSFNMCFLNISDFVISLSKNNIKVSTHEIHHDLPVLSELRIAGG